MHATASRPAETNPYLHLIHPYPTEWSSIFQSIAKTTGHDLVPYSAWLAKLEKAAEDPKEAERNPAIKLLDFYRGVVLKNESEGSKKDGTRQESRSGDAMGFPAMETTRAVQQSETLRNLKPLDEEDAQKWLGYWRKRGFLA
jgi:hypothetical protein